MWARRWLCWGRCGWAVSAVGAVGALGAVGAVSAVGAGSAGGRVGAAIEHYSSLSLKELFS